MSVRRSRPSLRSKKRRRKQRRQNISQHREMQLESLEDRRLLAVGPELVAVQPNNSSILFDGSVRDIAPTDLVFRFDDSQVIDPASVQAIQVTRNSDNMVIAPGFVGIGERPNEVVFRFNERLNDGEYTIDITGDTPLRNSNGNIYENVGALQVPFSFQLNLGAQVVSVVPQPISRSAIDGSLSQNRNQIVVYFNDDDLDLASAQNPNFYQLIFTNDTVENTDDVSHLPSTVVYDAASDTATLTFAQNIDQLSSGPGTYRLRIGTNEVVPQAPATFAAGVGVVSDFNTGDQVSIRLVPKLSVSEGAEISVVVTKSDHSAGANPAAPTVTVSGRLITVDLNTALGGETTSQQLVDAINNDVLASNMVTASIASGSQGVDIASPEINYSPLVLVDPGSSFRTATDLADFNFSFDLDSASRAQSIVVSSTIDPQALPVLFPGSLLEPGHRDTGPESHFNPDPFLAALPFSPTTTASLDNPDIIDGVSTIAYNFQTIYGRHPITGATLENVITEQQKQRVREVFSFYGNYLGIQFVETDNDGIIVATGDVRGVTPNAPTGPNGVESVSGGNTFNGQSTVVLNNAINWNNTFIQDYFEEVMNSVGGVLGLGNSFDLPPITVKGEEGSLVPAGLPILNRGERILPGDHDIVHGQYLYRPDSIDIDLYRFEINSIGRFSAETIAERQADSSFLDTRLALYQENGNGSKTLIAQNDDYFSEDSFLEFDLTPGVYFVGVSASGNDAYDPNNLNTGSGGSTQGDYDLRLEFRPQSNDSIIDADTTGAGGTGIAAKTPFDGDADGAPGGVFNFWFRALPPASSVVTVPSSTIFVDKANQRPQPDGTLENPFNQIDVALQAIANNRTIAEGLGQPRPDFVLRIVGNDGPIGGGSNNLTDRLPYVLGFDPILGQPLEDGGNLDVPEGVTVMIDEGAVFKMRRSTINVGSSLPGVNQSRSALQVLGTPNASVYFTSFDDETIGADTNPNIETTPAPGQWGGLVFRNDVDRAADDGRLDYEKEGVFLNQVSHAELRYGGGLVSLGSVEQVVTPIFMANARPSITFNTITLSADAAMSANPDSFEESNYNDPVSQASGPFTLDYNRVGPDIHGNILSRTVPDPTPNAAANAVIIEDNSLNGLFVRINTPAGQDTEKMTVAGRWNDTDIVHIVAENLLVEGTAGGPRQLDYLPAQAPIPLFTQLGGSLPTATIQYVVTFIDASGNETPPSAIGNPTILVPNSSRNAIRLRTFLPTQGRFVSQRVYRSVDVGNGFSSFTLVSQKPASDRTIVDDGSTAGGSLNAPTRSINLARTDASVVIDPGVVVKLDNARIETTIGAQLIAEGRDGAEVVFTSLFDARYGSGATFQTSSGSPAAAPADWGGLYFGQTGSASIDHAIVAFGGGVTSIEGGFAAFNAIEIHQADVRLTNSVLENNANGGKTLGPSDDINRAGRGVNAPGAIYVQGAQPIIVNNTIRETVSADGAIAPAININVNALNYSLVPDIGRSTGGLDRITKYDDNQGPLIRGNRIENSVANTNAINGMVVRGQAITTQSVWDDTDITHVVLDEILIPDFHTFGGVRLESSGSESLVIKLFGPNAGFTAMGRPLDIEDRIGGTLQVVGQPGRPVVLTSLADDSVGAGLKNNGDVQLDTNNDGALSSPQAGDWRSISIEQYANDRNVEIVTEVEAANENAPGVNATPANAQFLGILAPNEKSGDENRRLGFEIQGFLSANNDIDTYSFSAQTGTEVWLDIDRSTFALNTVVEIVDGNGLVIARSDNSLAETRVEKDQLGLADSSKLLFANQQRIATDAVNILNKDTFIDRDFWGTNPTDAGMRVVLPGSPNVFGTYHVRVRSSSDALGTAQEDLLGGQSSGVYQLQIRLRETDEVAGTTVRFANVNYATNGIEVSGQIAHSPLLGEVAEDTTDNNTRTNAQNIGNVLTTDRGALSVSGNLSTAGDVDWYSFDVLYDSIKFQDTQSALNYSTGLVFDLDYADEFGRANTSMSIFDSNGRLVVSSRDSGVLADRPAPLKGANVDDLSRGSVGQLDPLIGPIQLPVGTYSIAVYSNATTTTASDQFTTRNPANPLVRLEPLDSINRIAQDRIGATGGATFAAPATTLFPQSNGTAGTAVPFSLGDVTLFVSQTGSNRTTISTVDPFTGQFETRLGPNNVPTVAVNDIALRGDGGLFGFRVDNRGGSDSPRDSIAGNFIQFDTGNAAANILGDDGIITYEPDADGKPVVSHQIGANGPRVGFGVQFNALAFTPNASQLFAVGQRGDSPFSRGTNYDRNILYQFDPSTFDGNGTAPGTATSIGPATLGRAATNARDRGQIPTDIDLVGNGVSVVLTPNATAISTGGSQSITQRILRDGDSFDVGVNDGVIDPPGTPNGNLTNLGSFELNSGPEALVQFDLAQGDFFRDGESFLLDGQRFEFDTGRVLVPLSFQLGALTNGALITITDNSTTPITRVFQLNDTSGVNTVPSSNIPILYNGGTALSAQIVAAIVGAIDNQFNTTTFNAQATVSNGRISLTGDTAITISNGNAGVVVDANTEFGVNDPTATAIRVEETFGAGEINQAIVDVMNGVPGNPVLPVPGVPNITSGAEGSRVNFLGANVGDFSAAPFMTAALQQDGVTPTDGTVGAGNIAVPFLMSDTGDDVAAAIITAFNNQAFAGVTANPSTPPGNTVTFVVDTNIIQPTPDTMTSANIDPFAVASINPNSAFTSGGQAPGGDITGTAFIGNTLWAVSDRGGLYRIDNPSQFAPLTLAGTANVDVDFIETATDLLTGGFGGTGIRFTALAAGPANLEGGRYANMLFAMDSSGNLHAFDTGGNLQPIFQGGATSVSTGMFGATGIAFSNLDYNLWHVSNQRDRDAGHGLEVPVTDSRLAVTGGSSLYFGNELQLVSNSVRGFQTTINGNRSLGQTTTSNGSDRSFNFDFPGGAHGSVVSNAFSLKNYDSSDQPVLYFNYFLDTENVDYNPSTDPITPIRDSFRVFASSNDPGAADQGQWHLLGTNDSFRDPLRLDEFDLGPFSQNLQRDEVNSRLGIQELYDNTDGWRQARIDLGPFAGRDDIRLRFDFASAGSFDVGNTGGIELRIGSAEGLRDGQQITVDGQSFEIDLGYTLTAPTGDAFSDGETVTLDDGLNTPVTFEFDSDNAFRRSIRVVDGSQFSDGDTFRISDSTTASPVAFEFDAGYSLLVPVSGASLTNGPTAGVLDGESFTIRNQAEQDVIFEFDTDQIQSIPGSQLVNVLVDVQLQVPFEGGAFGGVFDGDTFIANDGQGGPNVTFEFDSSTPPSVGSGNVAVSITTISTQDDVANAIVQAVQTAIPGLTPVNLGGGQVRLGAFAPNLVDVSGTPEMSSIGVPGTQNEVADLIIAAINSVIVGGGGLLTAADQIAPLNVGAGQVHLGGAQPGGGMPGVSLSTDGSQRLRQTGAPGVSDPNAVAIPFIPEAAASPAIAIAQTIASAIQAERIAGNLSVVANRVGEVVDLNGFNFTFSPGATALRPEGVTPIPISPGQSANGVAASLSAAIENSGLSITPHRNNNRVNLEDLVPQATLSIQQSAGIGSPLPAIVVDGLPGVTAGSIAVSLVSSMTNIQVRDQVVNALNQGLAPAAFAAGQSVFSVYDNFIKLVGNTVSDSGPFGLNTNLDGDFFGAFNASPNTGALRGQNNNFEGLYIDDIIVGFAERGELVTGAGDGSDGLTANLQTPDLDLLVGDYNLEIRRASGVGIPDAPGVSPSLFLTKTFDTNDRLTQAYSLFAPSGNDLSPGATFTLYDGVTTVNFEYVNQSVPGALPAGDNVAIFFSPTDTDSQIAGKIITAINSNLVQSVLQLDIQAATTGSGNRIDLFGKTVNVNLIDPRLIVTDTTTDANALRNVILGGGVSSPGEAQFVGSALSAGTFRGGTQSIGIESGIVLSTGDARFAQGPNVDDRSTGFASLQGDAQLDAAFGVTTTDTTTLEFAFELDPGQTDLFFNFVFASEEYNEFSNTVFNDVFGFFVDGENIGLVPNSNDPITINTINGGNPFGTAARNPQFFNNNDRNDGGQFLKEFGFDGFTDVFTASKTGLAPGPHTIRLAISDVGDTVLDSAVFIESRSFGSTVIDPNARNGVPGVRFNEVGDSNRFRDQGQLILQSNVIKDSLEFGVNVGPGPRDANSNAPHPSPVRVLEEINNERLATGVVVMNNVLVRGGQGGVRLAGATVQAGQPLGSVPVGRLINNTIVGSGGTLLAGQTLTTDIGILVEQNAAPTILNNVVANFDLGISVDATSDAATIIGGMLYQANNIDSNVGLGNNFPISLSNSDPLFVDPLNDNYYLEAGSQAIDSSINALPDRVALVSAKNAIGIPSSPLLAPNRDAFGQLRVDDPNSQSSVGSGALVFKDRGALDRVDFVGPAANLVSPRDNDADGLDQDPAPTIVRTSGQVIRSFAIELNDGAEPVDASQGTGIDPLTVSAESVVVTFFDSTDINLRNGTTLVEGIGYTFSFNTTNDTIVLTPLAGIFVPGIYVVTLDNSPVADLQDPNQVVPIRDIASNILKANQATGETKFTIQIVDNIDFGDAPDSYATTVGATPSGPSHVLVNNFFLGTSVDAELDGSPSVAADGDGADEDGVRINNVSFNDAQLARGSASTIAVLASSAGKLDAWIDFNSDGDFNDIGEKVLSNRSLLSGSNLFSISVPGGITTPLGNTYARFRLSSIGNLGPAGPASDGEVEDYRIQIVDTVVGTSPFQNPLNPPDVNANGVVSIADILLVINNIRNFGVRDLTPADLGVTPGAAPFVDVTGDQRLDISDVLAVVLALRGQAGSPEAEGESPATVVDTLDVMNTAAFDTTVFDTTVLAPSVASNASVLNTDLNDTDRNSIGQFEDSSNVEQPSNAGSSVALQPVRQELMLSAASFKTYEFESALDAIVDDVAGNWSDDSNITFNETDLLLADAELTTIHRTLRRL